MATGIGEQPPLAEAVSAVHFTGRVTVPRAFAAHQKNGTL